MWAPRLIYILPFIWLIALIQEVLCYGTMYYEKIDLFVPAWLKIFIMIWDSGEEMRMMTNLEITKSCNLHPP